MEPPMLGVAVTAPPEVEFRQGFGREVRRHPASDASEASVSRAS
jgi:hypothetical protein